MKRSFALAALIAASALAGCSSGGSAFAPLAAGAVAPSTPVPTNWPTPAPGPLSLSPPSLVIGGPNPTTATFNATETNYTSGYSESANCSGIAAIVQGTSAVTTSSNGISSSAQQYDVTQLAAGSCTAHVADNHGDSGSVAIASTVYGILTASPASIVIGNSNPVSTTVAIAESSYTGPFTESNNCAGIATVTLSPSNGPTATLAITQLASGMCTVSLADNHLGTVTVQITSTVSTIIIQSTGRHQYGSH